MCLCFSYSSFCDCAKLQHWVSRTEPFTWLRLGHVLKWSGHSILITLPWGQASMHALLKSRVQAFLSPPVSPALPMTSQGVSSPLGRTPGLGAQSVAQTAYSPKWVSACIISLSPGVLSRGTSSNMITLSSFLSDYVCISLTALVYRNLSAKLQLVFREKCFTCTFLFDVFTRGGKFPILLLCHVDWSAMPTFLWRDISDFKESND